MGVGLTTLQRWRRQIAGDKDGVDGRKGSRDVIFPDSYRGLKCPN